jgi:lysophospholipase L1-like esterase
VIGDSLTFGSSLFAQFPQKLKATNLWKTTVVDAVVGRSAMTGARIIQRKKLKVNTAILVALGTNDMMSRREKWYPARLIDEVMKAANGRPVLWLNLEYSTTRRDWRARGVRFNRQLQLATERWPNLTIADWDKFFTPNRKNRFPGDGVHLNVSAYRLRSTFMLRSLRTWATALYNMTTTTTTTTTLAPPSPEATPDSEPNQESQQEPEPQAESLE